MAKRLQEITDRLESLLKGDFHVEGGELSDDDELVVDDETVLELWLGRSDADVPVSVRELEEVLDELTAATPPKFDGLTYTSPRRHIVRLEPLTLAAWNLAEQVRLQLNVREEGVRVSLSNGLPFALALMLSKFGHDKFHPPVDGVPYLEVERLDGPLEIGEAQTAIQAALYELSSSLDADFEPSSRPMMGGELDEGEESGEGSDGGIRTRPLLVESGFGPLLELFNKAVASSDPEVSLLRFSQCIEFVSSTVARKDRNQALSSLLAEAEALRPTEPFFDRVTKCVDVHRSREKDRELIVRTLVVCAHPEGLASLAPPCAKKLRKIDGDTKKGEREDALREFGNIVYTTRNMFAHAKSNYTRRGDECPEEQLPELVNCVRAAANQCILWLSREHPEYRCL